MNHHFAQDQQFNHNLPLAGCFAAGPKGTRSEVVDWGGYYYPGD